MSLGRLFVVRESRAVRAVAVDVELLVRLLEWAREEASSDVEVHRLAEELERLSSGGRTLTMDDYAEAMAGVGGGSAGEGPPA